MKKNKKNPSTKLRAGKKTSRSAASKNKSQGKKKIKNTKKPFRFGKKIKRKKATRSTKLRAGKKAKKRIKKTKAKAEAQSKEKKVSREDLISELVAQGKQRGFVTEDEIIHVIDRKSVV